MEKVTIYKNKGETFRCHFKVEGAKLQDTIVRLCLEFQDSPNYFFHGTLNNDGECVIEIPRLKNLDEKSGKLTVEAIADSVYFKVYEADVELKNSVEVSMQSSSIKKISPTNVKLEEFVQTKVPEPVIKTRPPEQISEKKNEWQPVRPPQYKGNYSAPEKEKPKRISSFQDFTKRMKK